MDLQVYAIILIVFLVSFLSYLFISRFLPHGKTFDEMIAEKKRMREEVLGTLKSSSGKQNNATKKKPKKEIKKKEVQLKVVKEVTSNESDVSEESEVNRSEPATPPEIPRKQQVTNKTQVSSHNKKGNGKGKSGILVNKNEPLMVKELEAVEESNHFVEIHPKDAIEIHRGKEEEQKSTKNFRENKKSHKQQQSQQQVIKETPPVSPKKIQSVKEVKVNDEKIIKKKKSEQLNSPMSKTVTDGNSVHMVIDETGISPLIRELSRADLTKNQIQVLIDFLLNKQSDTTAKDPTEWTEGKSDINQKLRKQLQEKEAQLKNEQDALSGMQIKLKELRAELNTEKIQSNATLKAHVEQIQNCRSEIKTLQSEILFLNDKHNNEKQTLNASLKQLQAKFLQVSESLKAQESLPNLQKLQNDNQMLQQEIINKNQQIMEINVLIDQKEETVKQKLAERDSKIAEYDVCLRKKEEGFKFIENELRQRVQDITNRDNEILKLNGEVSHVKEIIQRQTVEIDQLKKQINEHHHQKNHAEENNKIEIRNLQNALDSSKNELEAQQILISDYKKKLDELNRKLESKSTQKSGTEDHFLLNEKMNEMIANHQNIVSEKDKQLSEYQKQIEALQKIEHELSRQIEEQKVKNNTSTASPISTEVKKVKEIFTRLFPELTSTLAADDENLKWLESVLENLKTQLASNKLNHISSTTTSSSNANHLKNNCSGVEINLNNNSSTLNGDNRNCSSSSVPDKEIILLQNAQLKSTVEEYKNIIAETESMLKNLESKVREQDSYWTKVVLMKDNEIENLKSHAQMS
ncbi:hypothetical protein PVAND_011306 [Polypedilum vanderplanki]|uniref:Ribosome-binding protein 1 n=1 Tax=Polypedilum vanderplanki TaxID=319348 RepID=A0A9J6CIW1_POLVA|nr:hypothetical protein PVAND_011306 [Polypedilum vanderplanki]